MTASAKKATRKNNAAATVAVEQTSAPTVAVRPVSNLFDKAIVLVLEVVSLGNRRKVSTSQIEVEADKTMIGVSKRLFECDEYDAIKQKEGEMRRYIYSRALPSYFRNGTYLVPNKLVSEIDEKLQQFKEERTQLIDAFIKKYDSIIADAKTRLRDVFNPADYQGAEVVRAQFALDWSYVSFGVPGNLEGINSEMFKREQLKAQQKWAEATDAVQQVLRENMKELVDHLLDRLQGGEDGKPKVFKKSMIDNFNDFLDTFSARNITDDDALQSLVSEAKKMLEGVDADELRVSKRTRTQVADGFAKMQKSLDFMLQEKPKRAISFEDVA